MSKAAPYVCGFFVAHCVWSAALHMWLSGLFWLGMAAVAWWIGESGPPEKDGNFPS